jgi:hypothetical protein
MYHLGEEEGPFQAQFHNYLDGTDLPEKPIAAQLVNKSPLL